ncbi:hypothetical protein DER45DRAFT_646464 [Fusarium avenaceum]|nr:hypothetical protein DER45DRAFT_646464 [Fusarium avenaceum]
MAEIVGLTASIIAIVELSAKLATYSNAVGSARSDISRLQSQLGSLDISLKAAQRLINEPKNHALATSRSLIDSLDKCQAELARVQDKLDPSSARKAIRRFGFRALKWPFDSKEVSELINSFEQYKQTITLCLQVDQTTILLNMSQKVEGMSLNHSDQRPTGRTPCFNVPFDRDTDFVPRPNINDWLKEKYKGPSNRMALVGLGGLGKSQVAIHFAYQIREQTPETSVYWVHASSKPRFEEGYRHIAERNELPRRNDPQVDVLALVRDWLQTEKAGSWLMILDNADDINLFYPIEDNGKSAAASVVGGSTTATTDQRPLAACLPKHRNGSILVTSRSLDVAEKLTGSHKTIFQVSVMDDDQGLQLLHSKLIRKCDDSVAIELLRNLDFIPLAITQAAAYINRRSPRESAETYLTTFLESDQSKRNLLNRDAGDLRRDETVSNSVITTWQVTFEHIRREKPSAAKLLSFMSFFNPHGIPIFVLRDYSTTSAPDADVETASFEDDLDVLRGYSLVTVTTSTDLCEMHAMVQACTRIWVSASDGVEHWKRLFLQSMCNNFPNGDLETWPNCQLLLPHIEVVTEVEPPQEDLQYWACLLTKCGYFIGQKGNFIEAERFHSRALTVYSTTLGEDHEYTLVSRYYLAVTYYSQGRFTKAEEILQTLLDKEMMISQERDFLIRASMSYLALVYGAQGRMKEAEAIHTRLLEWLTRVLGKEHPDTLRCLSRLASTLLDHGQANDAEEILVTVLATQKKLLGEEDLDTLVSMTQLAESYEKQGRYEEAEDIAVRVLEAFTRMYGKEHPVTLLSTARLATVYEHQGRLSAAEDILAPSVVLQKKVIGKGHPGTRESMRLLGAIWTRQGRLEEASALFQ